VEQLLRQGIALQHMVQLHFLLPIVIGNQINFLEHTVSIKSNCLAFTILALVHVQESLQDNRFHMRTLVASIQAIHQGIEVRITVRHKYAFLLVFASSSGVVVNAMVALL
jgi:hypothetical protein